MSDVRYSRDHEWVGDAGGDAVRVGITAYAADALGDVVYVGVPKLGEHVEAGEVCGEVESTKSVSDLFSPVTGEVVAVNQVAVDDPTILNRDPEGEGWLFAVRTEAAPTNLLTRQEYEALVGGDG